MNLMLCIDRGTYYSASIYGSAVYELILAK